MPVAVRCSMPALPGSINPPCGLFYSDWHIVCIRHFSAGRCNGPLPSCHSGCERPFFGRVAFFMRRFHICKKPMLTAIFPFAGRDNALQSRKRLGVQRKQEPKHSRWLWQIPLAKRSAAANSNANEFTFAVRKRAVKFPTVIWNA